GCLQKAILTQREGSAAHLVAGIPRCTSPTATLTDITALSNDWLDSCVESLPLSLTVFRQDKSLLSGSFGILRVGRRASGPEELASRELCTTLTTRKTRAVVSAQSACLFRFSINRGAWSLSGGAH